MLQLPLNEQLTPSHAASSIYLLYLFRSELESHKLTSKLLKDSVDRIQLPVSAKSGGLAARSPLISKPNLPEKRHAETKQKVEPLQLGGCACNVG